MSTGLWDARSAQHMFGLPKDSPAATALVVEWPDGEVTRVAIPRLNEPITVNPP